MQAQPLGCVALWIERHEKHLRRPDRVGVRDAPVHRRERRQRSVTARAAAGVAQQHEGPTPLEAKLREGISLVVDEGKGLARLPSLNFESRSLTTANNTIRRDDETLDDDVR